VAVGVVDGLEVVQVQHQQRSAALLAQCLGQRVAQREAVGQAGERIGVRQLPQAALGLDLGGFGLARAFGLLRGDQGRLFGARVLDLALLRE